MSRAENDARWVRSAWAADRRRYGRQGWTQQSLWAITLLRFGQWNDAALTGIPHRALERLYWACFVVIEVLTKVSITKEVQVGPGLRIHHCGPVVVNATVRIGANCTIEHGVTLGTRHPGGPTPVVGDGVMLGAYAHVLGDVHVGDGAQVGAMAVVLQNVPDGATAVGIPARIVDERRGRRC